MSPAGRLSHTFPITLLSDHMVLRDKIAVVTGASRGLGLAFSVALIEKGATVYGLARSTDDLKEVGRQLGDRFHGVECDVRQQADVDAAFDRIEKEAGRCDVLLNNAGLGRFGKLDELKEEDWHVQIDTNLSGIFYCTRRALPMMKRQNESGDFGGHIVNVASVAGLVGNAGLAAYNTTKFGVRGFSEALMKEVREDRIKVTCIYPGTIATEFFNVAGTEMQGKGMDPREIADTVVHVLEASENYLISEVMMRPLRPKS
jgi:NAD(P)-dependent dehydrogenase (short-subunit alcohol dehydrogenase family)